MDTRVAGARQEEMNFSLIPHPLSSRAHRHFPQQKRKIIGQVTAVAMRIVDPEAPAVPARLPPQLLKRP